MSAPSGIVGLTGREPIGAVLTVGHKGPKGNPEHTDRFYIVVPNEVNGVRAEHPAFAAFNKAAHPALADERHEAYDMARYQRELAARQIVRGNLVHASPEQCFEHHLKAQVLQGHPAHPAKAPHCVGDGRNAKRWDGRDFREIVCPNEGCEFRQAPAANKPTPCKPWMRFLFRPRWADGSPLPMPLMKFTSGAWNTTANFLGLFQYVAEQASALGVARYTLYGLPFTMQLTKKKRKGDEGGRAFPVVSIAPEVDLQEFLWNQHTRALEYSSRPVAALTDREQQDPAELYADQRGVSGPVSLDLPGSK